MWNYISVRNQTPNSPPEPNSLDTLIPLFTSYADFFFMYLAVPLLFDCFNILVLRESKESIKVSCSLQVAFAGLWNTHFTKISKVGVFLCLSCYFFVVFQQYQVRREATHLTFNTYRQEMGINRNLKIWFMGIVGSKNGKSTPSFAELCCD